MATKKKSASKSRVKKAPPTAKRAKARKASRPAPKAPGRASKHIPQGYGTVTPFLSARGAAELLEFLKRALGAEEVMSMPGPGGTIMHAEVNIGGSRVMISETMEGEPSPGTFYIYVPDADALHQRALDAGATSVRPMTDEFWGDRVGMVRDSFGNVWSIATHVEDVSPEEIGRRAAAAAMNR
jgi:PhnB protein